MSLTNALNISLTGLDVSQRGLGVVAGNIANVETEGYTRKTIDQTTLAAQNRVIGVRAGNVERVLNEQVQIQLREVAADNVGNDILAGFLNRLDVAFGQPGSPTAIDQTFNDALASLQQLSTSPDDFNLQVQAVNDIRVFTNQLNSLSDTIQGLRREADIGIGDAVEQVNAALRGIDEVTDRIVTNGSSSPNGAFLEDERDRLIDEVAQIIDIRVERLPNNGVNIQTTSGVTLYNSRPAQIDFNTAGTIVPQSNTANGTLDVPTVSVGSSTVETDLFGVAGARSGALAAYGEVRDTVLVQVQAQLDEFAAQLSLAISNTDIPGVDNAGRLEVDTTGIQDGNTVAFGFTNPGGQAQAVTFVQVDNPASLPVSQDFTANPNDIVIGLNFNTASAADIQAALDAAVPANGLDVTFAGGVLSFGEAAALPGVTLDSLSASITNPSFANGLSFPLFEDGTNGQPFTNGLTAGSSKTGFAGRIQVSQELLDDPSLIARFTPGTGNLGDSSRVDFILERIQGNVNTYSPTTGLGAATNPIQATSADFLQNIIASQGQRAEAVQREADASQISFNNIQERLQSESSVNIDRELAQLVELEQAYQANARVLSAVQELVDALLSIV